MAVASLPRTASRSRSSPRWTTTSACCASYSARTEDRRTSCISAQPLSGGARPLASTAAEDAGAQRAQFRFQLFDPRNEAQHHSKSMRVEIKLAVQPARLARDRQLTRIEGPRRCADVDRNKRSVVDQLAQLGLGQSGELDQLRPLDRAALVDAQRLAGFNVPGRPAVQIACERSRSTSPQ